MEKKQKNKKTLSKEETIFEELLTLLKALNIRVKYERGVFNSGFARYKDDKCFYLNRKSKIKNRITLIVNELKQMEIPQELLSDDLKKILTS
jgi:hypothetical protein